MFIMIFTAATFIEFNTICTQTRAYLMQTIATSSHNLCNIHKFGSCLLFVNVKTTIASSPVQFSDLYKTQCTLSISFYSEKILASDEGRYLRDKHQRNVATLRDMLYQAGLPVMKCPSHILPIKVCNHYIILDSRWPSLFDVGT